MLKLKARVTDVNDNGDTPLHLAFIDKASDRVIELLLDELLYGYFEESDAKDIRSKNGLGIFHIACARSDEHTVEQLYSKGVFDISAQVSSSRCCKVYAGYSPLHFAVESGNHEMVKFLCTYESEIYVFTPNGSTPLHLALERRDFGMVNVLCMNDLRYRNCVNVNGTTHFMAACANCDPTWVKMYLTNSCNNPATMLNARVKDGPDYPNAGYTPLHFACLYGRDEIVAILLDLGVHLTLSSDNLTPFDIVRIRFKEQTEEEIKDIYRGVYNMLRKHCKACKKCKDLVIANDKRLKKIEAKAAEENKNVQEQLDSKSLAVGNAAE